MASSPRVSIVMPLFNDEEFIASALESCLAQSLTDIEVICVDDASTDRTVEIVEEYRRRDSRIRLIRQPRNLSAFQARRAGITAARASYTLFLDGDDSLMPHAARITYDKATSTGADVVGFGVEIVTDDATAPRRFEAALQPTFSKLDGPEIVPSLFPVGEAANGHVWRYLFATRLLQAAYDGLATDLTFYRANDLPITLLALAQATRYVSTSERLYRYYFRRGTSGHAIDSVERFEFLLSGIDPISEIADPISRVAANSVEPEALLHCYESARLHIIATVLRSCIRDTSGTLQRTCLSLLEARVGKLDLVRAAASFCRDALEALSLATAAPADHTTPRHSVLLHTAHLDTGGLQSVLLEQAAALTAAGFKVTIAVLRHTTRTLELPAGVAVELVTGDRLARTDRWLEICRDHEVDVILDHHILYNENWAWLTLAALSVGIPTIGWVHNFALRPIFDASKRTTFLTTHMRLLWRVVTLSPSDVAFWKLRGVAHVVYLPNPLSSLALTALENESARTRGDGPLRLVWWGRLDGPTKQVLDLVSTARELLARDVDFTLTLIGPDSKNLTAELVHAEIVSQGVEHVVELRGEHAATELVDALEHAHMLVSTSAIEGAPLTLIEAEAFGLPVVMYDLPWLTAARNNSGMVRTTPGDPTNLADAIAEIAHDPARYKALSSGAREFAAAAASIDVDALTVALIADRLPVEYSPEPSVDDARLIIEWLVRFAERNARGTEQRSTADVVALRRRLQYSQRRLQQVVDGPSFRLGRILTLVPRKLRDLFRRPTRAVSGSS